MQRPLNLLKPELNILDKGIRSIIQTIQLKLHKKLQFNQNNVAYSLLPIKVSLKRENRKTQSDVTFTLFYNFNTLIQTDSCH